MNDQELVELAARAAGITSDWLVAEGRPWEPLEDDGDALRLAIACQIQVTPGILTVRAQVAGKEAVYEDYDGDEKGRNTASGAMTSVRRAIVRAAAEIGRAMP